jgi:hypothetical protein
VNVGFATWDDVRDVRGAVLLVVNSLPGHDTEVVAAFDAMRELTLGALHVIAPPTAREQMAACGVADDQVHYSVDQHGRELEVNHFLEMPNILAWAAEQRFELIAGTAPHSLYNDEIKPIFEQRVALLLRIGRFVAHALPERGLYLFDLPALVQRFDRESKTRAYVASCRDLVADLHRVWVAKGSPGFSDQRDRSDIEQLLAAHIGPDVLRFDEYGTIPIRSGADAGEATAHVLRHLGDVLRQRHDELAATTLQLHATEAERARVLEERNEAVAVRDRMISTLSAESNMTTFERLRRWLTRS